MLLHVVTPLESSSVLLGKSESCVLAAAAATGNPLECCVGPFGPFGLPEHCEGPDVFIRSQ